MNRTTGGLQNGCGDQRIAARPVVAIPRPKPHALAVALDDQPLTVVFDFVDPLGAVQSTQRPAVSTNTCTDTSSYSIRRRRSSLAISLVTSRDKPSAVLKATMRKGWPYWPSMRLRISVSRSVAAASVSRQAQPSRAPKVFHHQIGVRPFGPTVRLHA